jgi:hypothetical protein
MNLSLNDQFSLFASFSSYFKAASWPTYSSMSCEAALKSEKNIPQSGSHLEFRPCQSPGIEIVGEGIVSREYNPPPRQLNRGSFRIGLNPSLSPIGVYIKNQNLII